ncbi:hypothetical protein JVU11DRAFT_7072 [Chiua virens]|nr:hypothetical protein JVU11DRAFT_7072 [Chiua virens]
MTTSPPRSEGTVPPSSVSSTSKPSATLRTAGFFLAQFVRKFGAGICQDISARAPWYLSDWTDAWNYRVFPATTLIFLQSMLLVLNVPYLVLT